MSADESVRRLALLAELRDRVAGRVPTVEGTHDDRVQLCTADSPSEPRESLSGTAVTIVAQGSKRVAIGDRVYDYGPGQYLIASVDLPVMGNFTLATADEPALSFGMILRPAAVASLILEAPETVTSQVGRAASVTPGLGVADASADLLDAVVRMVRALDSPGDRQVLAASIEREIVWRLLTGPLGAITREIGRSDSTLTHVSSAVRWIADNYSTPFRVEDLARDCGLSPSAFHRNFRAVTALTPIQFQKQIRLQRSRLMLMTGGVDVATVGHRVGYSNISQFNREYRRQFGLPPGRDATRLRSTAELDRTGPPKSEIYERSEDSTASELADPNLSAYPDPAASGGPCFTSAGQEHPQVAGVGAETPGIAGSRSH